MGILFASTIALVGFIAVRLGKWLWRLATVKLVEEKPVKGLKKLSPVSQSPAR